MSTSIERRKVEKDSRLPGDLVPGLPSGETDGKTSKRQVWMDQETRGNLNHWYYFDFDRMDAELWPRFEVSKS
jgi:hypothetical protein